MAQPPPPEKLNAASLLDRLLSYADKPWKAIVILLAIVICGIGYIIWIERARIADAVLERTIGKSSLNVEAFVEEAPRLLRDTRGDLVLLVEIKLIDNLMIDRIGIDPDGNRWVPSTGPQQFLLPGSNMQWLVQFLANDVVCIDMATALNEDAKALAARGYVRGCIVAVPPILGVNAGALAVAWKQVPTEVVETRAGYALRAAALRFASW